MSSARSPSVTARVADVVERFLHIEAVSGIILLIAAAAALLWANSPAAESYANFWHEPLRFGARDWVALPALHFWINEALMTIFFLVVGLEIRREMSEGTLASLQVALLPLAAAVGGIVVPAIIYLSVNDAAIAARGWAVPIATDIAFAVGVLALLGKAVPSALRVLLLALAVIDDIAAVIIIAFFYSGGMDPGGFLIAALGVLLVFAWQRLGIRSAFAYLLPGAVLWLGLLRFGVHPTLAGVILGLLTPTAAAPAEEQLLPPVVRVQAALHPWVSYAVMPLFALANAGIALNELNLDAGASQAIAAGVFLALVVGKPAGILLASWLVVRIGWCALPRDVDWRGVAVIGFLGGIGFTMAIFIATLAFAEDVVLGAAKLGVLAASGTAAALGLIFGRLFLSRRVAQLGFRA
jgi:NhaA family Na+:H+ antiporter